MNFVHKQFYSSYKDAEYRIEYNIFGNENATKTLFCVHGLSRNSRDFDYVATAIAEASDDFRIICPDIVGRGKSEWLDRKDLYNYETYMNDMNNLIIHENAEEIYWLGSSMGGILGMMMLFGPHKDKFQKLILNDIGPFIPGESLSRIAKYVGLQPEFISIDQAEKHIRKIFAPFGIKTDEDWRYITNHSITINENSNFILAYDTGIANHFKPIDEITDVEMWDLWNNVNIPTLILRGMDSDILLHETAMQMLDSREDVMLIEYPAVGHTPSLMEPQQIQDILDFLLEI